MDHVLAKGDDFIVRDCGRQIIREGADEQIERRSAEKDGDCVQLIQRGPALPALEAP